MKERGTEKENCLLWLVKVPLRLLVIARDAYVRSITSCSGAGILISGGSSGFNQLAGNFDPPNSALLRSFTLTPTERDQYCMRSDGKLVLETAKMRQSAPLDHRRNYRSVVVMGRIDEEDQEITCDDDFEEKKTLFLDDLDLH